ncbi:MAG: trypsin-like serine protease [Myxococcales bacterium FL481]|nr:MAG: trypsin-like serine protease [Myxococcales bacterium FL481]
MSHTVSSGIVSAVERTDVLPNPRLPVVQLDASINLGDSGGPLFNLAGEIVGITTARSRKGQGIGFAIPIDRVHALLRAVERGESSRLSEIKLTLVPGVDPTDRIAALGYSTGIVIESVPDGPAKRAGILARDVVVEMEGSRFDEFGTGPRGREAIVARVVDRVRSLIPGETLDLVVARDEQALPVTIEAEAVSERRQILIMAEDLFGVSFEPDRERPTIKRFVTGSPVSQRKHADVLLGAEITHVVGRAVPTVEALGEVLEDLERRRVAGQSGLTVAIDIRDKKGKRWHVQAFPLRTRGPASRR